MLNSRDLQNLLPSFIEHLSSSSSSRSTIKNYTSDLRTILEKIPHSNPVGQADLKQVIDSLNGQFSESTLRRFHYSLKAFVSWAEKAGYILPTSSQSITEPVQAVVSPEVVTGISASKVVNSQVNSDPVADYVSNLQAQGSTPKASNYYKKDLENFFSWLKPGQTELKPGQVEKVSRFDINRYTNYLKSKQASPASIKRYLHSLGDFFSFHKKKVIYQSNPVHSRVAVGDLTIPLLGWKLAKPRWWHAYRGHPISDYANWTAACLALILGTVLIYQSLNPGEKIDITNLRTEIQKGLVLGATPPRILSFQGRLTNPSGNPVTAATNFVFRIWDQSSGGTEGDCDPGTGAEDCMWKSKTWSITPDQNGIFSVQLGDTGQSDTAIPASLFADNASLWLGVTIGADTEATPRQQIASSAYALNSDTLDGFDSGSFLRSDDNDSYTSGTLTTNGGTTLDINGTLAWGGATISETLTMNGQNITGIGTSLTAAAGVTLSTTTTGALTLDSGTTGNVNLGTGNNAKTIAIGTGTAGNTINIGTDNTTSDSINIGSALDNVAITGDQWSITNAGVLTVVSCSGCGGGSQTPWISDIDADGFDLLDFGNQLTARAELVLASTGAGNDITINGADQFIIEDNTVFNTSIDATFLGTENFEITSDLDGSVSVLSLVTTPSSTSGTTTGLYIQQANSANTNGLDTGIFLQNSDTNLAIGTGINLSGLYSTGIKIGGQQDGSITTGITVGDNILGEDITTGFKYEKNASDITTSSTGTNGFFIDLDCVSCSSNTNTLTNGFRLLANEDSTSITNAINIEATNSAYIETGIKLGSLSSATSSTSETAISIGGGWDAALSTPFGGFGNFGNFSDYSEDFNNSAWTKSNVTVTNNSTVAPDNTTTADTLTSTSSDGFVSNTAITLGALTGTNWTLSVWLKVASTPVTARLDILSSDGTPVTAATGTVSVTTEWQRFYISGTFATETDTNAVAKITPVDAGTGAVIAWGAQLEYQVLQPSIYTRTESAVFSVGQLTGASVDGYLRVGQNAYIGALSGHNTAYGINLAPNLTPCAIFCGSVNTAGQEILANVVGSATGHASLHISNPTTTGTLTNNYGIYIDEQTTGSSSDVGVFVASAQTIGVQVGTILAGTTGFQGSMVLNSTGTTTGVNMVANTISSGTQNLYTATLVTQTTGTLNGIFIDAPASTSSGGTINGINIENLSSSHASSTDIALKIGSGWDYGFTSLSTKHGLGTATPFEFLQLTNTVASGDTAIQFEDAYQTNVVGVGPNSPSTTSTNNDNFGTVDWVSAANITASDDSRATVTLADNENSYNLRATNFGFSIPTEAKVTGVKVEVERSCSASCGYVTNVFNLVYNGQVVGAAEGGISLWSTTDSYETQGSNSNLWNYPWTVAEINSSTFGFQFDVICTTFLGSCSPVVGRIDHVRVTVYYALAWEIGMDSSDSGNFKISRSTELGTDDVISLSSSSVTLGSQANSTPHTFGSTCACIVNTSSTAGSFNPNTSQDGVFSSVVYNGKLYVSTKETNDSSVYRYDGGTTWTQVTDATEGKIISGDSDTGNDGADAIVLNVFNGLLWAGTQTGANVGAMYSYDGATWSLRQTTRGTFGAETLRDGVSDVHIYNGRLYISTQETNGAGVYRFDGNNTWTRINTTLAECDTTPDAADIDGGPLVSYAGRLYWGTITGASTARVCMYDGNAAVPTWSRINTTNGTLQAGTTGVDDVTSMTVFNGQLVIGTGEANLANIYISRSGVPLVAGADPFYKTTSTSGRIDATNDATDVDAIPNLRTYNGRLYATSQTGSTTGAIYEFNNCGQLTTNTNCWTLVNGARGTFGTDTSVINVLTTVEFNGVLYVGTEKTNAGGLYTFTKTSANSYYLRFNSGNDNYGSIYYTGSTQAQNNSNHTGTFFFNSSINSTTGSFDLAEDYPTFDTSLEPGEIVSVDPRAKEHVKRAEISDKKSSYIGIISTDPGFKLSQKAELVGGDKYVPVALSGRVPLRVNSEGGNIEPGDLITLSSIPGVGTKAVANTPILGKALEDYSSEDVNAIAMIMVYVDLGYYGDPDETALENFVTVDSENNVVVALFNSAKFIWKNSSGATMAWVNDLGEASFTQVTSLIGDFRKLVFGEAVVKKDAKTAGEATFTTSETEVFIESDKVTEESLINLTAVSKTNGVSLYVMEKRVGEGFVVALERNSGDQPDQASASATQAIKFTWFILNQQ